ncbi:5'-methylthioadenosine nucleosidase [Planctomicrobium sp. SH661]|uniref:phosphorylase family protein n=1 Tax=Planctomicrobium sp. SH661 TaxID=3448124 RepID=UPI003F5BAF26
MNSAEAPSVESQEDQEPVLGIVCALNLEVAPFLKRTEQFKAESGNGFTFRGCRLNGTRICVVEGGTGRNRARQATHALIDAFQPPWILSVGFSGALVDDLKIGHIVVADGVTDRTGSKRLAIDLKMQPAPEKGLHVGHLCATDEIVRLVQEKRDLAAATGAIAVDMESLGVAEVCQERRTRFMSVRVISDDLSEDLPREVLALLGPKGTVRAGALFGSILKRPGCVKDLWSMREKAIDASEHLGAFLPGVINGLARTLAKKS